MKILAIRQEGTESTGAMLFVELLTRGRFGPIEVSFALDPKTGEVIEGYVGDFGAKLNRKPTEEEKLVCEFAHNYVAIAEPRFFPIEITAVRESPDKVRWSYRSALPEAFQEAQHRLLSGNVA